MLKYTKLSYIQQPEHAGGDITSTFDAPEATKLGHAKLIEEIMIGEDRLIHFSGVAKAEACTIVLRGASGSLCLQRSSSAAASNPTDEEGCAGLRRRLSIAFANLLRVFGCVDSLFGLLFGTRKCKVSGIVLWQFSIGEALTCLTAGSHVLDEAERSLHDALCVLNAATADSRVLYGGGWPEMQMAKVGSWRCSLIGLCQCSSVPLRLRRCRVHCKLPSRHRCAGG